MPSQKGRDLVIAERFESQGQCRQVNAKAEGYAFDLESDVWVLDKNVSLNVSPVSALLAEYQRDGFRKTLAFFAENYSSHHAQNLMMRFYAMLSFSSGEDLTVDTLINYRSSLDAKQDWYIGVIRVFLNKWYALGYEGVSKELVDILAKWRIKGNQKGEFVKRLDPNSGPLTDIEIMAFNEKVVDAFERGRIGITRLCICLLISHTGRRSIQLASMKVGDVNRGSRGSDGRPVVIKIPRSKNGLLFRSEMRNFSVTESLHKVLCQQAKFSISSIERSLGFQVTESLRDSLPLFPDLESVSQCGNEDELAAVIDTDRLHIIARDINRALYSASKIANVRSERTGKIVKANSRRFRYTTGTRAAREGYGELVIAELLDHRDTQNAGVYIKNIPEHVKSLDKAVGLQLAKYAQAFSGVLVDSEKDAVRGGDIASRIRSQKGSAIGTCGEFGFCGAGVPIPCYTCIHFQPWVDGPHAEVLDSLLHDRERILRETNDGNVASALDRTILAVSQVIDLCEKRLQTSGDRG